MNKLFALLVVLMLGSARGQTITCDHSYSGSSSTCKVDSGYGGIDPLTYERATQRGLELNRQAEQAAREQASRMSVATIYGVAGTQRGGECIYVPANGATNFVIKGEAYTTITSPGKCVARIVVLESGQVKEY